MFKAFLPPVFAVFFLSLASAAHKHYCETDICTNQSGMFCQKLKVILVTSVACPTRMSCPQFVYTNVLKYCSFQTTCHKRNILVAPSLCAAYRHIRVTYTCIEGESSMIQKSCGSATLPHESGFLASVGYPASSRERRCLWSLSIADGHQAQLTVYDLATGDLYRHHRPVLKIAGAESRTNCTPEDVTRVVTMDTKLPEVATFACSRSLNIELSGNYSNARVLVHYRVGVHISTDIGNRSDPQNGGPILPVSYATSSCRGRSDTKKWYRIILRDDRDSVTRRKPVATIGFSSSQRSTVAMVPMTIRSGESSTDTKTLLTGIGAGVAICGVCIIPVAAVCVWCLRRRRRCSVDKKESEMKDAKSKTLHFHECTFITDNALESPVYATIDETMVQPPQIDCDPYSEVIDILTNPPPPPRRLKSVTGDTDSGSGHTYAEIQRDFSVKTTSDKLDVITEVGGNVRISQCQDLPLATRQRKLARSHSEPCRPRTIFIFPTTVTNCYAS